MERFICVHGHFYQPPRENPWLEAIELQDSAYPYHDWNEKITAECYSRNATSRILDDHDRIVHIVNNYAKISFNFGPTLLAWLAAKAPDVYKSILQADRESRKMFSGHGSAIAQAYNHMILPLANRRDRYTQIIWGIRDFRHRFGREPEGMWLPETAVDLETLDIMAEQGISFTILSPHQAKRVRPVREGTSIAAQQAVRKQTLKESNWSDVSGARIDPTTAYTLRLPSRRTITLFFYDGPISRSVAFERLLNRGDMFAQRLIDGFSESRNRDQLVHISTDGESYGHHHRFGDMALAYALHYIESRELARLTVYGEYMNRHLSTREVEIFENTSWSCIHGVERWRSNCGCNTGAHPGWSQAWRAPLRDALDWLRDRLAAGYEEKASYLLNDPWSARNDYIQVILDRSTESVEDFMGRHAARPLTELEKQTVLKLMELQRHAMLMYTSCGWFFDELSGIETVQIMQYAGRALQLAQELLGDEIETHFIELLERAKSNISDHGNGRRVYEKFVRPAMIDLKKVGAHYAVSSLFEEYAERTSIYCYTADREAYQTLETGRAKLVVGTANLTSEITRESARLCIGVLHFGDHNLNCGVRLYRDEEAFGAMAAEVSRAFARADFPATLRLLDKHFGASTYSLKSLFRDEQRAVMNLILQSTLKEAEEVYRQLYNRYAPMMRFLKDSGIPTPRALYVAAEIVLNASIRRAFEERELDPAGIRTLCKDAELAGISLHADTLEYSLRKSLEDTAKRLLNDPKNLDLFEGLENALDLASSMPFRVNLWKVQNTFNDLLKTVYPVILGGVQNGDEKAAEWIRHFTALSEKLSVRVAKS